MTDAGVTTGLVTVLVAHVAAVPQPGVLIFVKLARFEIDDPLASLAFTVTRNDRVPVVAAATEVKRPGDSARGEADTAVRGGPAGRGTGRIPGAHGHGVGDDDLSRSGTARVGDRQLVDDRCRLPAGHSRSCARRGLRLDHGDRCLGYDPDDDGGWVREGDAVVGPVREGIDAGEVRSRRVGKGSVGIERESGGVGRSGDDRGGQRAAAGGRVVAHDAGRTNGQRLVLDNRVVVVDGDRRGVRADLNRR